METRPPWALCPKGHRAGPPERWWTRRPAALRAARTRARRPQQAAPQAAPAGATTSGDTAGSTSSGSTSGGTTAGSTGTSTGGATAGTVTGGGNACTPDGWDNYAAAKFSTWCSGCHALGFSTLAAVKNDQTAIEARIKSKNMPQGKTLDSDTYTRLIKWMDCGLPQ